MGLSRESVSLNASLVRSAAPDASASNVIALAGNPNVGKSTVFNALTGLRQHTGNWPGKTVGSASGECRYENRAYSIVDLPGCYSLMAHSAEEEAARNFICFSRPDTVIIVCDATCLERNLNLALQTLEITSRAVICVNLMDEAQKKRISVNLTGLSARLGVPVVGCAARSNTGLEELMQAAARVIDNYEETEPVRVRYPDYIEEAIAVLKPCVSYSFSGRVNARWLSLMLINWNTGAHGFINEHLGECVPENIYIAPALKSVKERLNYLGITEKRIEDDIVSALMHTAEDICKDTVIFEDDAYRDRDNRIDNLLTGRHTAFPVMLLALMGIFWLTITGANYPSAVISGFLFWLEERLLNLLISAGAPKLIYEPLVLGIYRVLAWVVSVMLPPMAIFFPLFTLLEDVGFLPRVAFNLDKYFKKCSACGKQALTMCMGNICYGRKEP